MLSKERLRELLEQELVASVEHQSGSRIAVDNETGDEVSFRYRGGVATVLQFDEATNTEVEQQFRVRVEIV